MKNDSILGTVAGCCINMLGMFDMYAEAISDTRDDVTIHGYSFEPRERNQETFDAMVQFIVPRLPGGMHFSVAVVCPNGLLEYTPPEESETDA